MPDLSNFAARFPVILGTPTISHVVSVMKEKEIGNALGKWVCRMAAIKVGDKITEKPSSDDYDQVVFTQNVETKEAFSSCVVQVRVERAHTRGHINVMIQALWTGDGSLPQGLTIQNTYMELRQGSKNAVVMVRNSMSYPQTLKKKTPVARAVAATPVPDHLWRPSFRRGE